MDFNQKLNNCELLLLVSYNNMFLLLYLAKNTPNDTFQLVSLLFFLKLTSLSLALLLFIIRNIAEDNDYIMKNQETIFLMFVSQLFQLMGNCCFQPATSITSIEEHFDNNNNAEDQKPTNRQLVQAAVVEEKEEDIPAVQARVQDGPKVEDVHQERIIVTNKQPSQQYEAIIQLFALIYKSYSDHDVDSCIPIIKRMNDKITILCKESSSSKEDLQRRLQQYTNKHHQQLFTMFGNAQVFSLKTIQQIRRQHADILHYEEQIKSGNWEEKSNKNGSILCTRNQANSVGVLIEMDLELPFEILISILTEIDLYPQFIAFNEVSKQEKIFSRNCRIGYNLNNYPFLSKRQAFFQGVGYSRLKTHQQVFLFTRSIHDKPELQEYLNYQVKINPDYVQLTYKYFVVKYRPIKKGLGRLTMALNADIGLGFLPNFVLEYLAKDFAKQFLQCILEIGKKFKGSQWEKKVQQNPALFDFFKKEIEEYIKNIQ